MTTIWKLFRRLVPLDNKVLSKVMKNTAPSIEQIFIKGKSKN